MAVHVSVVGPGEDVDALVLERAEAVGRELAVRGAVVICGGLGGAMAAACRGAASAGGVSVGLLPGADRAEGNEWLSVAIPTGMGELRNGLVARAGDAMIAVDGGYGTLSEMGFALKLGRPVVGLGTWDIEGVMAAADPAEAVQCALAAA
ncbi:MAG: hypothetical protein QOJ97_3063 [Solirubrobacteraceae bacterium]|nr:hypothetical protein [Solirubrobacteraceae bacterium]